MSFPAHIAQVLDAYGIAAETKAALYDLYVSMGEEVLDVFADLAEGAVTTAALTPEDTLTIRARVVERYLRRNHPRWLAGLPTPSLWHPREAEGRASGAAIPLGELPAAAKAAVGEGQSLPDGMLLLGRNAHYGGRAETLSFDVVAHDLGDAIAIAHAAGQQHTLPGSVGATSGTFDSIRGVALLWEIQPNVYKPAGERNRAIARVYRRHRNWHLATLAAALDWLGQQRDCSTYILRGEALAITHEVNPAKPVSPVIAELHNRTVQDVAAATGRTLDRANDDDGLILLDSAVMNHALRKHVLQYGAADVVWRAIPPHVA
ncbi:MAG: hypothetical protein QOH21_3157 [Acidobacteriota bacterium]|nr:hypothetical protein [Acidobacteriota bacterium]